MSKERQEDGADAASISRGGHRGADHSARPLAGPQPTPARVLLQVYHLTFDTNSH